MRTRQHVNPLGLSFEEFRGKLPPLEPGREIELEIGCADAQFLFERAERDPSRLYVGIEIRSNLVDAVNRDAAERDLPVHAIFCNVNIHLHSLLPAQSVRRVYLNFPDPWFKRRHHKRRMIDDGLARAIHTVLARDGELFFQSDVWDIALETMDIFERLDTMYENRAGSWSFWKKGNPYGVRSWREQHCEEAGHAIWRIWYRRIGASL
ncbi:MAG: tRNA (guanosine(46)-N7)-methyltransferase TrmB [Myxococcota bacterium]